MCCCCLSADLLEPDSQSRVTRVHFICFSVDMDRQVVDGIDYWIEKVTKDPNYSAAAVALAVIVLLLTFGM